MTKPIPQKYKVGDKLWFAPNNGKPFECTIVEVGKRWLYFKNRVLRVDKYTLLADAIDCDTPGRAYDNRQEYDSHMLKMYKWNQIGNRIRGCNDYGELSIDDLDTIIEILDRR